MSLDKVESSNPFFFGKHIYRLRTPLTANDPDLVHRPRAGPRAATHTSRPRYMRGRARGKLGTCNQLLRMPQMPKGGCFAFSRLASHIRVLSKSGEKPALLRKTTILDATSVLTQAQSGPKAPKIWAKNAIKYVKVRLVFWTFLPHQKPGVTHL